MPTNQEMTISEFKRFYERVKDRADFSERELTVIESAIGKKDIVFLKKIYKLLIVMIENEKKIYKTCDNWKNEIVDEFNMISHEIVSDFIVKPKKEKISKAEEKDKIDAEKILNKLE